MSVEFTGERVIPGYVDVDLWNEHFARYAFASRLCAGRSVLDVGCGTGYGTAELARYACLSTGIDPSVEALAHATANYGQAKTRWVQGSATAMPFADGAFDLIVCFEVIEHLEQWRELLHESRRLLSQNGQFIVSTPNRSFYAETRKESGPNPFHVHEFDYAEFVEALFEVFPAISMYVEDHSHCVFFRAIPNASLTEARVVSTDPQPEHSNFFLAVCGLMPGTESANFVYLPSDANLLRERSLHIERLQSELALKERWLAELHSERDQLAEVLRERTAWAAKLDAELAASSERIIALQQEVEGEQAAARHVVAAYEAKIVELEAEIYARTEWATATEQRLTQELGVRTADLTNCHELLQAAESTLEERTLWAQSLDRQCESLTARVSAVQASRWIKLGRLLGIGPEIPKQ